VLEEQITGLLEPPNTLPDPNTGAPDKPNAVPMLPILGVAVEFGVHIELKAGVFETLKAVIAGLPEISNYNIKSYLLLLAVSSIRISEF